MRIDKFLWSVRFYKTRSIATDEIKKNRVSLGNSPVKSSKEVKEGEPGELCVKGPQVPLHIVDRTEKDQYEILKQRKLTQDYYRIKGEGRPTKKDRRAMDEYVDNDATPDAEDADWDLFFSDVEESSED